jgi:DNA-binding transcriptional MerR regulator
MTPQHDELWTIDELEAEVARALSAGYEGSTSGRVRDVPDVRTIRYYTTLGLMDRPAEIKGRTAYYGPRHLLQLVAIKQLQANGLSLADVQQQMAAASDSALKRLAGGTDVSGLSTPGSSPPTPRHQGERVRAFWKSKPASIPEHQEGQAGSLDCESQGAAAPAVLSAHQDPLPVQALRLAENILLILESSRSISPAELIGIRRAAAPLIQHLLNHGLVPPDRKGEEDVEDTCHTD